MMLSKEDFFKDKEKFVSKIKDGAVFIISTDTIYGLHCDATNPVAVMKVRQLKKLPDESPVSVIAPSKEWILENCVCSDSQLDRLPGPYTLIFELKNQSCVSFEVNNGVPSLGVRIPDHWSASLASELGVPLVTTSANVTGKPNMTSVEDLDSSIKVDFVVDEGVKEGKSSKGEKSKLSI